MGVRSSKKGMAPSAPRGMELRAGATKRTAVSRVLRGRGRRQMKTDLAEVAARLSIGSDPMDRAVTAVRALMQRLNKEEVIHV